MDFSLKDEIKNPCIERMRVLDYWINELISAKSASGPEETQKALDASLPFEICAYAIKNPDLLRVNKVFPSTFERFYSDMNFINKKRKAIIDGLYARALIENELSDCAPKTKSRVTL